MDGWKGLLALKWRDCLLDIEAAERERGFPYEYVIRTRPDINLRYVLSISVLDVKTTTFTVTKCHSSAWEEVHRCSCKSRRTVTCKKSERFCIRTENVDKLDIKIATRDAGLE